MTGEGVTAGDGSKLSSVQVEISNEQSLVSPSTQSDGHNASETSKRRWGKLCCSEKDRTRAGVDELKLSFVLWVIGVGCERQKRWHPPPPSPTRRLILSFCTCYVALDMSEGMHRRGVHLGLRCLG